MQNQESQKNLPPVVSKNPQTSNRKINYRAIGVTLVILGIGYYYYSSLTTIQDLQNKVKILRETVASLQSALQERGIDLKELGIEIPTEALESEGENQSKNQELDKVRVKNIRIGEHPNFVRVVFDLETNVKATPKVEVSKQEKRIEVKLFTSEQSLNHYSFQQEMKVNFTPLVSILSNQFEQGVIYWLNLNQDSKFDFKFLEDPLRLVVDIEK